MEEVVEVQEEDPREHLNVVFIGHVDAGKSTFCGQILYQTGQVDVRTIEKYEKEAKEKNRESWFLAFIMDTNEEERAKGKTVEVGRAHFESANKRYTILDAPGAWAQFGAIRRNSAQFCATLRNSLGAQFSARNSLTPSCPRSQATRTTCPT